MSSNEAQIIEFGSRVKITGYQHKMRGRRTVYEGDIIYNAWDEQQGFKPTRSLTVFLVVTSFYHNPIYCSLDQIELLTEENQGCCG